MNFIMCKNHVDFSHISFENVIKSKKIEFVYKKMEKNIKMKKIYNFNIYYCSYWFNDSIIMWIYNPKCLVKLHLNCKKVYNKLIK